MGNGVGSPLGPVLVACWLLVVVDVVVVVVVAVGVGSVNWAQYW